MKKLIFISILFLFSCNKNYTCRDTTTSNDMLLLDYEYKIEASPKEVREWVDQGNLEDYTNGNSLIKTRVCN